MGRIKSQTENRYCVTVSFYFSLSLDNIDYDNGALDSTEGNDASTSCGWKTGKKISLFAYSYDNSNVEISNAK